MISLPKSLPIAILVVASCCLIVAQQSREEGSKAIKAKLLDAPSVPYKLEASDSGRGYQFCNTSAIRIVRFRLGCVEKKDTGFKILSQRAYEDGGLLAADGKNVSCRLWDSNHGFFPGEACKKGKLAVTDVELADGTIWNLKPSLRANLRTQSNNALDRSGDCAFVK